MKLIISRFTPDPHYPGDRSSSSTMSGSLLCLLGVSLCLSGALAMHAGTDVMELTPSNFQKEVIRGDSVWIVEFYAPW